MQTLSFDLSGMTCGGCTGSVQRALSKIDGVSRAEICVVEVDGGVGTAP